MATSPLSVIVQHLSASSALDGGGTSDGELLTRFLSGRDGNVLAALVRRHAPMVWGVCCRILHNHHEAEDAFQATFLVFIRKAADVPRQAVANWLYGVARQTAVRLRATAAKPGRRETQVVNMPEPTVAEIPDAGLRSVLDEELSRLPDHYRGVIVLCDLEGMTRNEAARQLGIPEGSVASRLARARALLAKRLIRRGVVLSSGSILAVSAPPALVASTIRAVGKGDWTHGFEGSSPLFQQRVVALTDGVVKTMCATKIKSVLTMLAAIAVLTGVAGLIYQLQASEQPPLGGEQGSFKMPVETKPLTKEEKLRALVDNVLAAHGGEEKLRTIQFTLTMNHDNGETQHYLVGPPKCFRWETTHRDTTSKRICILLEHGRHWWRKEQNREPVHFWMTGMEPKVEYWHSYVKFFGPRKLLLLKDPDHQVTLLDEEIKVDGRAAIGVEVAGRQMYFDKETHLLVKQGDVTFSNYKKFDGIMIAQEEHDGHYEPRITDFRVVDKFDAKLFEKP